MRIFVTGISTEVGKTLVASMLVSGLNADYWKPVQAGDLHQLESDTVRSRLATAYSGTIHAETFRLSQPMSPHASAAADGIDVRVESFSLPSTSNTLVIEGAGGVLVPLNEKETVADLIRHCDCPVVLVSRFYLGSINHTLLSIEALRSRNIPILGVVFNGPWSDPSATAIVGFGRVPVLGHVPELAAVTPEAVLEHGATLAAAVRREYEQFTQS